MPVHGTWRMLRANAKLAASTGVPQESILLAENGVSVDLVAGKASISGAVPVGKMFVDGLIAGDVGDITLGERLILSSGFVAVTVVVRRGTGQPLAAPHLHSRVSPKIPRRSNPPCARWRQSWNRWWPPTSPIRSGSLKGAPHGRQVGGETYRRQPMIVPTVIEV